MIGSFFTKTNQVKCSQVMFMEKFGPTALDFGKDFFSFDVVDVKVDFFVVM